MAPPPSELASTLKAWKLKQEQKKTTAPPPDPVHGTNFNASLPTKKKGTAGTEMSGVLCFLEFLKLCGTLNATYHTADQLCMAWGRWVINPKFICNTPEEATTVSHTRKEQCGELFRAYCLPVASFRTYVNGMTRAFTEESGQAFVASSRKQMPEFQIFMGNAIERSRSANAVHHAMHADVEVIQEEEYKKMMDINVEHLLMQQRQNILALAYCTGLRADSIARLTLDSFQQSTLPDGRRTMTIVLGNLKNLPAEMNKCDAAMFKQIIVQGPDARYCPIEAIDRQFHLVRTGSRNQSDDGTLFRSIMNFDRRAGNKPSGPETYRGVAAWVARELGRDLTFKDVGRRRAMTRLTECPDISLDDIAKYFGVSRSTIAVYHRSAKRTPINAGAFLSRNTLQIGRFASTTGVYSAILSNVNKARTVCTPH
jgi:hypothetical protein